MTNTYRTEKQKRSDIFRYRDAVTGEYIYNLNQYHIKQYTDDFYKLIKFKRAVRTAGYDLPSDSERTQCVQNDHKLENNIARARSKIFELGLCNEWDCFGTFTIDGSKHPRDDLKGFYAVFSKWLNNYQSKHGKIQYLFVPELHSDEVNWHFHGLIRFQDKSVLQPFNYQDSTLNMVQKMKLQDLHEKGYVNWPDYQKKFGFCSFSHVRDAQAIAKYITKYVNKNLYHGQAIALNQRLYYHSLGLNEAQIIKKGDFTTDIVNHHCREMIFDFENDYVSIVTLDKEKLNQIITL